MVKVCPSRPSPLIGPPEPQASPDYVPCVHLARPIVPQGDQISINEAMSGIAETCAINISFSDIGKLLGQSFPFGCSPEVARAGISEWFSEGFERLREPWACDISPDFVSGFEDGVSDFLATVPLRSASLPSPSHGAAQPVISSASTPSRRIRGKSRPPELPLLPSHVALPSQDSASLGLSHQDKVNRLIRAINLAKTDHG